MRWGADIGKHDGVRRWPTCWGQISSIALGSCIGQHAGSNIDQQVGHRHWPTCWGQTLAAMLGPKNQGNLFIYEATTKNGSTARGCCRQPRTKKLSKGDLFLCIWLRDPIPVEMGEVSVTENPSLHQLLAPGLRADAPGTLHGSLEHPSEPSSTRFNIGLHLAVAGTALAPVSLQGKTA